MSKKLNRRDFLKNSIITSSLFTLSNLECNLMQPQKRPNILVILTDQQQAKMLNCAGNSYLKTPAMNQLAQTGIRFTRTYCTDPVCVPSRFSLMTGRMPHEIGLRSNNSRHIQEIPPAIKEKGIGFLFKQAGYSAAYGGKVHLPKLTAEDLGFDYLCKDERDELARICADYIEQDREQPFFLVASFINPHDICYMAIRDFARTDFDNMLLERGVTELERLDEALELPENVSREEFLAKHCPPLPPNFEPQHDEPAVIKTLLNRRQFRKSAREKYTAEQWRMHRWAYCRLTEMVDAQIGRVLDALEQSGQAHNTIVIFTSDHGDMDSAHRMEHKTVFYEEASNVPLIIRWPGVTPEGLVDQEHLISNGLDLVPTLCDLAGIAKPADLEGLSLEPLLEQKKDITWRKYLPVESEIGHMLVSKRYKYIVYDQGQNEEQVFDLENDPGEMQSVPVDDVPQEILADFRKRFEEVFR